MTSYLVNNKLRTGILNKLQSYFFTLRKNMLNHRLKKIKTKWIINQHNRNPVTRTK